MGENPKNRSPVRQASGRVINMDDSSIVELYWARSETAVDCTDRKYGKMLNKISYSLLLSHEDAEECVNDTYLAAWQRMPTDRPLYLGAFLAKIVRAISIDRYRARHRKKRDGWIALLYDELSECIPDCSDPGSEYERGRLAELLNAFLESLPPERRSMFLLRYFCSEPISNIAARLNCGESRVKTSLHRMRAELREKLEKEGLM